MHCAHAAVHRRIIILAAGGYADQLRLDVLRNDANLFDVNRAPHKSRQRRRGSDHERRGTGDARAGGRFRICLQREPGSRLEEANQIGRQRMLIGLRLQQLVETGEALVPPCVLRSQNYLPSASRSDFTTGQDVDRNVDTDCTRMEKVQRPDVECPAGQIGAAWRRGNDLVAVRRGHGLRSGWHDRM